MSLQHSQPLLQCLALLLCLNFLKSSQVLAQTGDGGAALGVEPGDIGSDPTNSGTAGGDGADTGSVNLSRGATVAIAVVVSVVVILGVTMTVLFFMAKKRQWKIKESLRRSARKVTSAVKAVTSPITPKRMTFAPIGNRKHTARSADLSKRVNEQGKSNQKEGKSSGSRSSSENDLEKGLPESTVKVKEKITSEAEGEGERAPKDKRKPKPPQVNIPPSSFEMDSPKTPMWKKVFGR